MWTTILEWAKGAGIILLIGLLGLITYCVFDGDDVKKKNKTVYFVILSETIAAAIAFFSWRIYSLGNPVGGIIGWAVAGLLAIGFAAGAVYGHKKGWKRDL